MGIGEIFLLYVCPTMGGLMSTLMFAAPINDMLTALQRGFLGDLNPFPFAMMTGNTAGWLIYGYYVQDPFILAANLPGLILSIWLNAGAAKLQYLAIVRDRNASVAELHQVLQRWDADRPPQEEEDEIEDRPDSQPPRRRRQPAIPHEEEDPRTKTLQMTPQETLFLRVLVFWSVVLIYTSWLYPSTGHPAKLVGILVNINLVAFYAAPLQTIHTVISEGSSASIHYETMVMNWINTSFWIGYGCARRDPVIVLPNATGLVLGMAQGALCLFYPRESRLAATLSLQELESDHFIGNGNDNNPEDGAAFPTAAATIEEQKETDTALLIV